MGIVIYSAFHQIHNKSLLKYNDHGIFLKTEAASRYLKEELRQGDKLHKDYPVKYPVLYYLNQAPVPGRKYDAEHRYFYILRSDRNTIKNYNQGLHIKSDSTGNAIIFICMQDLLKIIKPNKRTPSAHTKG
jgi:hypothetical protein